MLVVSTIVQLCSYPSVMDSWYFIYVRRKYCVTCQWCICDTWYCNICVHHSPYTRTTLCTHAPLSVHTHHSPYTRTILCTHAPLSVHTHPSLYTRTTLCTHAPLSVHTHHSPYTRTILCTHAPLSVHTHHSLYTRTTLRTHAPLSIHTHHSPYTRTILCTHAPLSVLCVSQHYLIQCHWLALTLYGCVWGVCVWGGGGRGVAQSVDHSPKVSSRLVQSPRGTHSRAFVTTTGHQRPWYVLSALWGSA